MTGWLDMLTRGDFGTVLGGPLTAVLTIVLSFTIGHLVGWVYMWTHVSLSYSRMFVASLVVIPVIVAMVMMLMANNIIVAFGLLAVFAVVRFRNVLKDTRDTTFILWTIVEGMAVGTMKYGIGAAGLPVRGGHLRVSALHLLRHPAPLRHGPVAALQRRDPGQQGHPAHPGPPRRPSPTGQPARRRGRGHGPVLPAVDARPVPRPGAAPRTPGRRGGGQRVAIPARGRIGDLTAMPDLPAIKTPLRQQIRRIRYQLVPVLMFGALVLASGWLWSRHAAMPNAVGEVQAQRVELASQTDGLLAELPRGRLELYERVDKDQVLAWLDDRQALASLDILQKNLARLTGRLAAAPQKILQDQAAWEFSRLTEARRLEVDVKRLRLELLDRQATVQTDQIELQRLEEQLAALRTLYEKGAENVLAVKDATLQRDVVQRRIQANEQAIGEAQLQLLAASQRAEVHQGLPGAGAVASPQAPTTRPSDAGALASVDPPAPADPGGAAAGESATTQPALAGEFEMDTLLEPIRAAITAEEARMRELEMQIQALRSAAPCPASSAPSTPSRARWSSWASPSWPWSSAARRSSATSTNARAFCRRWA